jgi:hypothetical protein
LGRRLGGSGRAIVGLKPPEWLPHYHIDVKLDCPAHRAEVRQTVRWTNPADAEAHELWFHVYPNHRPDERLRKTYERTLESLRVDPRTAVDVQGRRITIESVRMGAAALLWAFDSDQDTLLRVTLPAAVKRGETVEVVIDFTLSIPPVQGRFGSFQGVTSLVNWYPLVAYHGPKGWDAPPFVAWHQPWLNEAGNYDVTLTTSAGEEVATSGMIIERTKLADGRQRLRTAAAGLRDFAIIASKRFVVQEADAAGLPVRVYAFPEHRVHANHALATAVESVRLYQDWFGPYPYPQLSIVESFFGWNGNESSGLVMIDERVFETPLIGRLYVDHLVGHEICHQWWYAAVGTDGYRESWMDEGLVVYFNELRVEQKYGANPSLIEWPTGFGWLPNVEYETLLRSGYHSYRQRGGRGQVLAPLPEIGHIHNLFFLVYDRGSKVTSMIHQRLGDEKFFQLFRQVYAKYSYRILFVADFQRELEEFSGQSWAQFFDDWLRSPKITDWKLLRVQVDAGATGYQTRVRVRQLGQIAEPVEIGYFFDKRGPASGKVLLIPEAASYQIGNVTISRIGADEWEMALTTRMPPEQVMIDPDRRILDANPFNNRWRPAPEVRFTPLYTPVDEASVARPIDRPSFVFGPNIDQEGRLGVRGSLTHGSRYRLSPFISYTPEDAHWTVGVDSQWYEAPAPNLSIGARYEHSIAGGLFDDPQDQARLYLRWHQVRTTSFIFPDLAYFDLYFRVGDNFFPDEDFRRPTTPGVEDYRDIRAVGVSYQLNTLLPYWNPEKGYRLEATYEYGFFALGGGESYHRAWGQLSAANRLPEGLAWLSETRLVGRIAGGVGAPENGEHFRFGGPLRFRGQRSEDTEGSRFWLASADWRFPLLPETNVSLVDNIGNIRSLYGSIFYDVGESYLFDDSQGVDHAIGAGLYFHLAVLSFVEQLTLRLEFGHSLRRDTDVLWFGIYHAF